MATKVTSGSIPIHDFSEDTKQRTHSSSPEEKTSPRKIPPKNQGVFTDSGKYLSLTSQLIRGGTESNPCLVTESPPFWALSLNLRIAREKPFAVAGCEKEEAYKKALGMAVDELFQAFLDRTLGRHPNNSKKVVNTEEEDGSIDTTIIIPPPSARGSHSKEFGKRNKQKAPLNGLNLIRCTAMNYYPDGNPTPLLPPQKKPRRLTGNIQQAHKWNKANINYKRITAITEDQIRQLQEEISHSKRERPPLDNPRHRQLVCAHFSFSRYAKILTKVAAEPYLAPETRTAKRSSAERGSIVDLQAIQSSSLKSRDSLKRVDTKLPPLHIEKKIAPSVSISPEKIEAFFGQTVVWLTPEELKNIVGYVEDFLLFPGENVILDHNSQGTVEQCSERKGLKEPQLLSITQYSVWCKFVNDLSKEFKSINLSSCIDLYFNQKNKNDKSLPTLKSELKTQVVGLFYMTADRYFKEQKAKLVKRFDKLFRKLKKTYTDRDNKATQRAKEQGLESITSEYIAFVNALFKQAKFNPRNLEKSSKKAEQLEDVCKILFNNLFKKESGQKDTSKKNAAEKQDELTNLENAFKLLFQHIHTRITEETETLTSQKILEAKKRRDPYIRLQTEMNYIIEVLKQEDEVLNLFTDGPSAIVDHAIQNYSSNSKDLIDNLKKCFTMSAQQAGGKYFYKAIEKELVVLFTRINDSIEGNFPGILPNPQPHDTASIKSSPRSRVATVESSTPTQPEVSALQSLPNPPRTNKNIIIPFSESIKETYPVPSHMYTFSKSDLVKSILRLSCANNQFVKHRTISNTIFEYWDSKHVILKECIQRIHSHQMVLLSLRAPYFMSPDFKPVNSTKEAICSKILSTLNLGSLGLTETEQLAFLKHLLDNAKRLDNAEIALESFKDNKRLKEKTRQLLFNELRTSYVETIMENYKLKDFFKDKQKKGDVSFAEDIAARIHDCKNFDSYILQLSKLIKLSKKMIYGNIHFDKNANDLDYLFNALSRTKDKPQVFALNEKNELFELSKSFENAELFFGRYQKKMDTLRSAPLAWEDYCKSLPLKNCEKQPSSTTQESKFQSFPVTKEEQQLMLECLKEHNYGNFIDIITKYEKTHFDLEAQNLAISVKTCMKAFLDHLCNEGTKTGRKLHPVIRDKAFKTFKYQFAADPVDWEGVYRGLSQLGKYLVHE